MLRSQIPTLSSVNSEKKEELFFKFVVVGNSGVGKTSIIHRYTQDKFSEKFWPTVGAEFSAKAIELDEQTTLRLQIWDLAGQESFNTITKSFYRNADTIFLVYDVNNRESFENLETWLDTLMESADPDSILILIGNKSDQSTRRKVSHHEGINFMKEHNMHFFFETSASQDINIKLAFLEAAKLAYLKCMQDKEEGQESSLYGTRDTISLRPSLQSNRGKNAKEMEFFSKNENAKCAC